MILAKSRICKCGHQKSKHKKFGCEICGSSGCKGFTNSLEVGPKNVTDKLLDELSSPNIKKLSERYRELGDVFGKSVEKIEKRSEKFDELENFRDRIRDLDTESTIAECNKKLARDSTDIEAWLVKANALQKQGKYEYSLQCAEDALVFVKDSTEKKQLLKLCGHNNQALKKWRESIKNFSDILNIDDKDISALNEIGYSHIQLEEYDEAIANYSKTESLDKSNHNALENLGYCYRTTENFDKALDYQQRVLNLEDSSDNYYYVLNEQLSTYHTLFDREDKDEYITPALETCERLIKDHKHVEYAWYVKAQIFKRQEKYDEAITCFKKHLELGERSNAYFGLGFCYGCLRKNRLSIIYYKKYETLKSEDSDTCYNLGNRFRAENENEKALEYYEKALKLEPKSVLALARKIQILGRMEQYEEIVDICEKNPFLLEFDKEFGEETNGRYIIIARMRESFFELKRFDEALNTSTSELERIKKMHWPRDGEDEDDTQERAEYHYQIWHGWILEHLVQYEEAKKCYETAINLNKNNNEACYYLANLLREKLEDYASAIRWYDKALGISKDNEIQNLFNKGLALKKLSNEDGESKKIRNEEAEKIFDLIIEKNDRLLMKAWNEKGNCNWNLKNNEKAIENYLKAAELDPNWIEPWKNLGDVCYDRLGNKRDGLVFYEHALSIDENDIQTLTSIVRVLMDLKKPNDALFYNKRILELDNNNLNAMHQQGWIMIGLKKFKDAIKFYETYIEEESDPKDRKLFYAWGNSSFAYNELENYSEAIKAADMALQIIPNPYKRYLFPLYNKGIALEKQEKLPEAKACFVELVGLDHEKKNKKFDLEQLISICKKLHDADDVKKYEKQLDDLNKDDGDTASVMV